MLTTIRAWCSSVRDRIERYKARRFMEQMRRENPLVEVDTDWVANALTNSVTTTTRGPATYIDMGTINHAISNAQRLLIEQVLAHPPAEVAHKTVRNPNIESLAEEDFREEHQPQPPEEVPPTRRRLTELERERDFYQRTLHSMRERLRNPTSREEHIANTREFEEARLQYERHTDRLNRLEAQYEREYARQGYLRPSSWHQQGESSTDDRSLRGTANSFAWNSARSAFGLRSAGLAWSGSRIGNVVTDDDDAETEDGRVSLGEVFKSAAECPQCGNFFATSAQDKGQFECPECGLEFTQKDYAKKK